MFSAPKRFGRVRHLLNPSSAGVSDGTTTACRRRKRPPREISLRRVTCSEPTMQSLSGLDSSTRSGVTKCCKLGETQAFVRVRA